jgi:squalene-hopene/tetraprenyl-beta-curcumene cyclase
MPAHFFVRFHQHMAWPSAIRLSPRGTPHAMIRFGAKCLCWVALFPAALLQTALWNVAPVVGAEPAAAAPDGAQSDTADSDAAPSGTLEAVPLEAVTLANVEAPEPNRADEPLAEEFSVDKAARFLDSAALTWQKERNCMTCHTNYLYLMARPVLDAQAPALKSVRKYAEELVSRQWKRKGPRWDAEVVMTASVLAHHDAATSGKLHPLTREALDRMWTVQRDDGGIDWLKCDWPPMESDDYYGATMLALATGVAPEQYAQTPAAREGIKRLKRYLGETQAPNLHHRAMLVWAASYLKDLLPAETCNATVDEMLALQRPDGGWALASLGDWSREDDSPQDTETSDGYATAFVIYVARRNGMAAEDTRLQKGVHWLKSNQRSSGRWFTRSLYQDNHHFISHAGTAMSVLALDACGALSSPVATTLEPADKP